MNESFDAAGHSFWGKLIHANVISVDSSTTTVVNQSPSNLHYSAALGTTFNEPGRIYSDVIKTTKVWLKFASGAEQEVDISEFPVALRGGHPVSLFEIGHPGDAAGWYIGMKNLVTAEAKFIDTDSIGWGKTLKLIQPYERAKRNAKKAAIIPLGILFLLYFFSGENWNSGTRLLERVIIPTFTAGLVIFTVSWGFAMAFSKYRSHRKPLEALVSKARTAFASANPA